MANADILTFHMFDNEAQPCGVKFYITSGQTASDVNSFKNAILTDLDAITDAYVDNVTWLANLALPGTGEKTAAVATGNPREIGATFLWGMSGRDSESIYVPAIKKSMVEGKNISLTADSAIGQAFVDQCETTAYNCDVTDGNEEALGTFKRVTKSIRAKR